MQIFKRSGSGLLETAFLDEYPARCSVRRQGGIFRVVVLTGENKRIFDHSG